MSAVAELRVEYLRAPIGIGTRTPRFSWTVDPLAVYVGDASARRPHSGQVDVGEGRRTRTSSRSPPATGTLGDRGRRKLRVLPHRVRGRAARLEHRVPLARAQSHGRRVDAVGGIHVRHRPAGCRRLGRRVGRARAAGRGRRALEHRRLDPRARSGHAARGASAPPAAAAAAVRRARRARARPAVRHRAGRLHRVRERAARRRPGARAGLRLVRAPHQRAGLRRDRPARRGRERARRRARRRLVGGTAGSHRVERAVRHPHVGDLAAAPRIRRPHDRGDRIGVGRAQRARTVGVRRPVRRRAVRPPSGSRGLEPRRIRRRRMDAGGRSRS